MADERYLREIAVAKDLTRKKINSYIEEFFAEREKAFLDGEDSEGLEGYDYWNEEFGLDVDEMVKDFINYLDEGF